MLKENNTAGVLFDAFNYLFLGLISLVCVLPVLHTLCEIMRCGGDYRLRGSKLSHEIDFPCADGCIEFRLLAKQIKT